MQTDNKTIEHVTAAITFLQLALNSMEAVKHTNFFEKSLKMKLNPAIKELIKVEEKYFDQLLDADDENTVALSENITQHFKNIQKNGFIDGVILGNIENAYYKNEKAITGIVNKILNN